jgi:hypothetical protein
MPGFETVTPGTLVLLVVVMLAAGLVHGTLGLGFPLVATPLLTLMMDVRSAILVTLLPTMTVNIISIVRGGSWRSSIGTYWPLVLYVPLATLLGTKLLFSVDPAPFRLLLAAIILLYLNQHRLRGNLTSWIKQRPGTATAVFGAAAGFFAGTVNVMVPVLIVYCLEMGMSRAVMVQVLNLCFLTGKASQAAVLTAMGTFSLTHLVATLPLAAAALAALLVGVRVRDRLDADRYRRWIRGVLFVIALLLIFQYFNEL